MKFDAITDILLDNRLVPVFEMYLSELLRVLLRQLGHQAPTQSLPKIKEDKSSSRAQTKSLLPPKYCRTATNKKTIEKFLSKAYNQMAEFTLIPSNLKNISPF